LFFVFWDKIWVGNQLKCAILMLFKTFSDYIFSCRIFQRTWRRVTHPLAEFLCKLALSKGKITVFFLLKGLEKVIHYQQVRIWKEENKSRTSNLLLSLNCTKPKNLTLRWQMNKEISEVFSNYLKSQKDCTFSTA
jgi:hypothetical protein